METRRLIFTVILAMIAFFLWQAWIAEHPSAPQNQTNQQSVTSDSPQSTFPALAQQSFPTQQQMTQYPTEVAPGNAIHVKTDVLDITIDAQGGNLIHSALLQYPVAVNKPDTPVILFNNVPATRYVAESGLLSDVTPDGKEIPVTFNSERLQYELGVDANELRVPLTWTSPQGIQFTKEYVFKRGQYVIDLAYKVTNHSGKSWKGQLANQLSRTDFKPAKKGFVRTFLGASYSSSGTPYEKLTYKKMAKQNLSENISGGWIAMQQHYFLSAWVPNQQAENHFYSNVSPAGMYTIGSLSPGMVVAPGQSATLSSQLYVGPELPGVLKNIAPHLELTVDYGWLWFISIILLWLLQHIYQVIGNWGWSIVAVTVLIK